jgi:hypothetical protein
VDGPGERSDQHVCAAAAWRTLGPDDIDSSIGERFRAQVEAHPGCLAVKDGDVALSSELGVGVPVWAMASRLALARQAPRARSTRRSGTNQMPATMA